MTDSAADLIVFLHARLAEDEQMAKHADRGPWEVGPKFGALDNRVYVRQQGDLIDTIGTCVFAAQVSNMPQFRANAAHIARQDPARILREVEAKRRILGETVAVLDQMETQIDGEWGTGHGPLEESDRLLRLLALPYSDHADYREEWRP